jgi:glyoxylase-like metal-dependent hydrolase (beta-lactamase superfamily II)
LVHEALQRLGRTPADLKHIIVSHAHQSHIRGVAALRAASGARVLAHEVEAEVLAGRRQLEVPAGTGLWPQRPLRLYPYQFGFVLRLKMPKPVEVDDILRDGDRVGPLTVLHTPGHSRGSLSFHWPERRLLIVADAVATWPSLMLGWPMINLDARQNLKSMGKLCDISNADVICVGHGDPILHSGADVLRDLVKGTTPA